MARVRALKAATESGLVNRAFWGVVMAPIRLGQTILWGGGRLGAFEALESYKGTTGLIMGVAAGYLWHDWSKKNQYDNAREGHTQHSHWQRAALAGLLTVGSVIQFGRKLSTRIDQSISLGLVSFFSGNALPGFYPFQLVKERAKEFLLEAHANPIEWWRIGTAVASTIGIKKSKAAIQSYFDQLERAEKLDLDMAKVNEISNKGTHSFVENASKLTMQAVTAPVWGAAGVAKLVGLPVPESLINFDSTVMQFNAGVTTEGNKLVVDNSGLQKLYWFTRNFGSTALFKVSGVQTLYNWIIDKEVNTTVAKTIHSVAQVCGIIYVAQMASNAVMSTRIGLSAADKLRSVQASVMAKEPLKAISEKIIGANNSLAGIKLRLEGIPLQGPNADQAQQIVNARARAAIDLSDAFLAKYPNDVALAAPAPAPVEMRFHEDIFIQVITNLEIRLTYDGEAIKLTPENFIKKESLETLYGIMSKQNEEGYDAIRSLTDLLDTDNVRAEPIRKMVLDKNFLQAILNYYTEALQQEVPAPAAPNPELAAAINAFRARLTADGANKAIIGRELLSHTQIQALTGKTQAEALETVINALKVFLKKNPNEQEADYNAGLLLIALEDNLQDRINQEVTDTYREHLEEAAKGNINGLNKLFTGLAIAGLGGYALKFAKPVFESVLGSASTLTMGSAVIGAISCAISFGAYHAYSARAHMAESSINNWIMHKDSEIIGTPQYQTSTTKNHDASDNKISITAWKKVIAYNRMASRGTPEWAEAFVEDMYSDNMKISNGDITVVESAINAYGQMVTSLNTQSSDQNKTPAKRAAVAFKAVKDALDTAKDARVANEAAPLSAGAQRVKDMVKGAMEYEAQQATQQRG